MRRNVLDNLAVARGVEVSHIVAIHQVDVTLFSGLHCQMRMRDPAA